MAYSAIVILMEGENAMASLEHPIIRPPTTTTGLWPNRSDRYPLRGPENTDIICDEETLELTCHARLRRTTDYRTILLAGSHIIICN